MPNSQTLPLFGHGSTVKAWCVTTNHGGGASTIHTGPAFDDMNFVDGYNLRLDRGTITNDGTVNGTVQTGSPVYYSGALKFSFVNPMRNDRYMVFVNAYGYGPASTGSLGMGKFPQIAHVVNSRAYPKTRESFWVRVGFFANAAGSPRPTGPGRAFDNLIVANRLWGTGNTQLGVVVF